MIAQSKSGKGLLAAIEGFKGEHAGNQAHESIMQQLDRVVSDVHKGSAAPQDSPGRQEAKDAAHSAFQRNHPSEQGHSGGDGQTRSNEPGPPARHGHDDEHPVIFGGDGRNDHMKDTTVTHTAGNAIANLKGSGFAAGGSEIRRIAAEKERSRPDGKMTDQQHRGDNNRQSVPSAPTPPAASRVGDAPAPSPVASSAAQRGPVPGEPMEPNPPTVPQQGDPFKQAASQARDRMRSGKRR